MSKTQSDLVKSVLEELFVLVGGETPEADDHAVGIEKIAEVMPEVERKGVITDWRGNASDELYMDGLAKLIAARVCAKFVMPVEIPIYRALEMPAWRLLSQLKSEPHQSRPVRASHI